MDAHERLTKLRPKKGQQPEIVRVLFECCGQEGVFNRFYALLAARLCASHREIKFNMQFAFWDEFKALGEMSLHRTANTAKLLAHVLARDALPIGLLKVIKWHMMSQRMLFFWQARRPTGAWFRSRHACSVQSGESPRLRPDTTTVGLLR